MISIIICTTKQINKKHKQKLLSLLMETLEVINQNTKSEYSLKVGLLLASLEKFLTLFGFRLGHLVFGVSETLSKTLQRKDTSLQGTLSAVNVAKFFCR